MPSIDEVIVQQGRAILDLIRARVDTAGHEDEIRIEATKGFDSFVAEAELAIVSRHEYGLGGGRIDSKYGQVIIEYKNPNGSKRLTSSNRSVGNRDVIVQLQERFDSFKEREKLSKDRIFGAGTAVSDFLSYFPALTLSNFRPLLRRSPVDLQFLPSPRLGVGSVKNRYPLRPIFDNLIGLRLS